jgi:cobalt-zinc-cadmium resistance protein CzcA
MVRKVVAVALDQPLLVLLVAAMFIGGGVLAFRALPVEAFPDVTDVQTTVVTLFPGHAAEEVEKQVTIPLEIELSGLPHAVRMFSHTQFGLSYLTITFDDKVDNYFSRQQVLERLKGVELPQGIEPELAPLSTPVGELYRYELVSNTLSPIDLRTIQDWIVSRYLRLTPGVADVVSRGGFIKQYQVSLDLPKMKAYNISIQQVFSALQRGNTNAGGSYIEQGAQQYLIRGIGLMRSSADIGGTVVSEHNGTPIFVRDIATVGTSTVPRQGLVGRDDQDEIVTGIVLMRKGENPSEVLSSMKERIASLTASVLPKNVEIKP